MSEQLEQLVRDYARARQAYLEAHEANVVAEEIWLTAASDANRAHKAMKAAEERLLEAAARETQAELQVAGVATPGPAKPTRDGTGGGLEP